MRWTKTKTLVQNLICERLEKRLDIHATTYNTYGEQRRIWITLDKKEIFNASSAQFLKEHDKLWEEIKTRSTKPFPECLYECYPEFIGNVSDLDYSMLILEQKNIFNVEHVYNALVEYPHISIEEALASNNTIIHALAMFDKRVGKRRLRNINFLPDTHPLVVSFYRIRCETENISLV